MTIWYIIVEGLPVRCHTYRLKNLEVVHFSEYFALVISGFDKGGISLAKMFKLILIVSELRIICC